MSANPIPGFISKRSPRSVPETVERLSTLLKSKGVAIFALIDHCGEAEKAGLNMRPTQLLICGNPKGGTPLMIAAPSTAIDLPLKALVWEDAEGKVWLSYKFLRLPPTTPRLSPPISKRISQRLSLSLLRRLLIKLATRRERATKHRTSNLLHLQSY